ncbi:MAG: bifunctional diaminohydroxyphosphoribosylaminopyrimidine deaminase/5-amino-6-(5-phosphoribosylamino)uracil reductase RibD, partial [Bacteroidia bacterium]|nr:bifunctional diaminohydroxyphosphoribosylaminopyrimidine deaminase/5-amino-6-(5-phosphoribosylamino)uracil reductase RibD [Bacteroidia bacterium]
MKRCLNLAALGRGKVSPNPLVGSVVYKDGEIAGEGYHMSYGHAHAEVNAIVSSQLKDLKGCTLFVNLEPCSHTGKTPPCADLIIQKNIDSVFIATTDPNPLVSGNGIRKLVSNGIQVNMGLKESESKNLNKRFFTFYQKKRPYIILKWAQSKEGFIGKANEKVWLSNSYSSRIIHKQRAFEDAILVGRKTFQLDQPALTTRNWPGQDSVRIVIDPDLKNVYSDNFMENAIIVSKKDIGGGIRYNGDMLDLGYLMDELWQRNIQSL